MSPISVFKIFTLQDWAAFAGAFGEALVWEPSRDGALFPHLHGSLDAALVDAHWRLDAPFVLPRDVRP